MVKTKKPDGASPPKEKLKIEKRTPAKQTPGTLFPNLRPPLAPIDELLGYIPTPKQERRPEIDGAATEASAESSAILAVAHPAEPLLIATPENVSVNDAPVRTAELLQQMSPAPLVSSPPINDQPLPLAEVATQINSVPPQSITNSPPRAQSPVLTYSDALIGSFEEFKARWQPVLRKGQMRLCEILYSKTYALGRTFCDTSFSELAQLTGFHSRHCFTLFRHLETLGFVDRERTAPGSNKQNAGSTIHFYLYPKK